eukprot:TRINITY_DN8423_c0_g1_i1.p3 TRINITY_DN8423_c0_g1~~TRINITY_DN8423_c0_g1_i1.p3  ORF type:complete len:103 (+),score=9.60 TRINITY_DN8423_c0_g1_i1:203-511(+)
MPAIGFRFAAEHSKSAHPNADCEIMVQNKSVHDVSKMMIAKTFRSPATAGMHDQPAAAAAGFKKQRLKNPRAGVLTLGLHLRWQTNTKPLWVKVSDHTGVRK